MSGNPRNRATVTIGGLEVPVEYYSCFCNPADASKAWELLSERCRGETVIVALPGDPPSPCTVAVALLHALEAKTRGAKIRKLPVLFLMELLGARQARDIARMIKSARTLVAASFTTDCLEEAGNVIRELFPDAKPLEPPECDISEAWEATVRSILSGRRLG